MLLVDNRKPIDTTVRILANEFDKDLDRREEAVRAFKFRLVNNIPARISNKPFRLPFQLGESRRAD
jgi:hypothetical protein